MLEHSFTAVGIRVLEHSFTVVGIRVLEHSGKYWWSTLAKDVRVYVSSCSVCAQYKAPRHLPRGKLQLLPVSQWPWSHLSVDFLTYLPPSQGNTTILVVVDRFSKSCRLLPLPGLPTALWTAEALFTHVFQHYGVPEDIVSDRGPQLTTRVWKTSMERLGSRSASPQVFTLRVTGRWRE